MVFQMCRPVWVRFMDVAVLADGLRLPGYDRRRAEYLTWNWLPTKWDWVDPLKDANAEIAQIEAGRIAGLNRSPHLRRGHRPRRRHWA